ncbi:MAG: hypothetical protein ACI4FY_08745 [Acetatifactor sp.]
MSFDDLWEKYGEKTQQSRRNNQTDVKEIPQSETHNPSAQKRDTKQIPGVFEGESPSFDDVFGPAGSGVYRSPFANIRDWPWLKILLWGITAAMVIGVIANFGAITTALFGLILSLVCDLVGILVVVLIIVFLWRWLTRGPRRRW